MTIQKPPEFLKLCTETEQVITDLMNREGVTYVHPRIKGRVDLLIGSLTRKIGERYGLQFIVRHSPETNQRKAYLTLIDLMNESIDDYADEKKIRTSDPDDQGDQ